MNTETNEKVLRLLGWAQIDGLVSIQSPEGWADLDGLPAKRPPAHEDPATVLAALEWMGENAIDWFYDPPLQEWYEDVDDKQYTKVKYRCGSTGTQAEAIIAGLVAWCELNGWPE